MQPGTDTPTLELRHIRFAYGERDILTDVSLQVPRGKVTALIGPMGAGKTTVLRLMGALVQPQAGQVLFDGADLAAMDTTQLYAARRRMGMLFQFGALFADMTVLGNVAFALREHTSLPERLIRDIVLMKLQAVGLRGARDLMPDALSGGMRRRVALARAIALDPELLLYDEPFSGLDPISLHMVALLVRRLNDALGLTSLLVSHELDETLAIADHVILLADGRVAAQGTPAELRASTDPLVTQYLECRPDGPVSFHYPRAPFAQELGLSDATGS
jgi:phospholipid/cholesterol/gamma-HCH transport system ATP-binding protein